MCVVQLVRALLYALHRKKGNTRLGADGDADGCGLTVTRVTLSVSPSRVCALSALTCRLSLALGDLSKLMTYLF